MTPTWRGIHTRLAQEMVFLWRPPEEDSWHEFQNNRQSAEAVAQDWKLGELPHLAELQSALAEWCRSDNWPLLSDGARYCLRMRMNAAADFVYLLDEGFPVPADQTEREIIRRLLTDWWTRKGRDFFALELCGSSVEDSE